MIIDITKSGYRRGYLPREGVGVFHPFFATANAAFRRQALIDAGGFDPGCATGEDIDACIRMAGAGWELWFEPGAQVRHLHRQTLGALLSQWFGYGLGHARLFRKFAPPHRLQLYRYAPDDDPRNPLGIRCMLSLPSPIGGMIFLSSFNLAWSVWTMAALITLFRPDGAALLVPVALALIGLTAALVYVGRRFDVRHPGRSMALCGLRLLADAVYVAGGLLGGLRCGLIYVEATRTRRRSARPTAMRQGEGL